MKHNFFLLVLLSLLTLCIDSCSPERKKILRVGTDAEDPPFNYLEGSEFKGIDIEISKKIAKDLGMQIQITKYEFDDLFSALALNKIDIAASSITITEKRKQTVDFTEPYFQTNLAVVAKFSSPFKIERTEDIGKYVVGCQYNTTSHQYLKENLIDKDLLPKDKLKVFPTYTETLNELLAGKTDLMVFDEWVARNIAKEGKIKIVYIIPTNEQYGLALQPGKALNKKIKKALQELKKSGELQKIINEFMQNNRNTNFTN